MKLMNCILVTITVLFTAVIPVFAQMHWDEGGIPLRHSKHIQFDNWSVRNPSGDIFIVWSDSRDGNSKAYGQKYNSEGVSLWGEDVLLQDAPIWMMEVVATSDNGIALVWAGREYYNPSMWAQKIDSDGNVLWSPEGEYIGHFLWEPGDGDETDGSYSYFNAAADASGGIIVAWVEESPSSQLHMYGKRLLSDGNLAPGWDEEGTIIRETVLYPGNGYSRFINADGADGLIFSWQENGPSNTINRAQRIDGESNALWGANGVQLAETGSYYNLPYPVKDGQGGAYFAWEDIRYGTPSIFMQRVDTDGNNLWGVNGAPLGQSANTLHNPIITEDNAGGFIAVWEDWYPSYDCNLCCQRVNSDGERLWNTSGVLLSYDDEDQKEVVLDSDDQGGLYAVWKDYRNYGYSHRDSYIQYVSPEGVVAWDPNGIMLSGGENNTVYSYSAVRAGDGGCIFAYYENTGDMDYLKLQKVEANGQFQFPGGEIVQEAIHGGVYDDYNIVKLNEEIFFSVWKDSRLSGQDDYKVYYQLFDIDGDVIMQENGEPIFAAGEDCQSDPIGAATSDECVIVTWYDCRLTSSSRIYAQKIDAQGNKLWDPAGIRIDLTNISQYNQFVCSDENGGAWVVWRSSSGPSYTHVTAQHFDSEGNRLLGDYGRSLTANPENDYITNVFPDTEGGVICVYYLISDDNIYAVRMQDDGTIAWSGLVYLGETAQSSDAVAIPSVNGGGIVAWKDTRNGLSGDIYIQKFDLDGNMLWEENGIPVIAEEGNQFSPQITEDENGFIYVVWQQSAQGYDIFCQRLSPDGIIQFEETGIPVCDTDEDQTYPNIVSDGQGGAIFEWIDLRNMTSDYSYDIYATHFDAGGQIADPVWNIDGNPVCDVSGTQYNSQLISDGYGGAIAAWTDGRTYTYDDLYVQRMNDYIASVENTNPSGSISDFKLHAPFPNPFNASTVISYQLLHNCYVKLAVYDITGREVAILGTGHWAVGQHSVVWNAKDLASGVYFVRLEVGDFTQTRKVLLMK